LRAPHLDLYFDARTEPVHDRHEAIDGESPEVRISDARKIGSSNPSAAVCGAHAQALPIERLNDLSRQDRLELLNVRVVVAEVAKNIPASAHHFRLIAFHGNISFSLFRRSVKAARQIDRAPSGNFSNSLSAALIHETGRVPEIIAARRSR
jgi:hypothetical protein